MGVCQEIGGRREDQNGQGFRNLSQNWGEGLRGSWDRGKRPGQQVMGSSRTRGSSFLCVQLVVTIARLCSAVERRVAAWAHRAACLCGQAGVDSLVATHNSSPLPCVFQVLRYFDYVFTGVFTFEMVIKVKPLEKTWVGFGWATSQLL